MGTTPIPYFTGYVVSRLSSAGKLGRGIVGREGDLVFVIRHSKGLGWGHAGWGPSTADHLPPFICLAAGRGSRFFLSAAVPRRHMSYQDTWVKEDICKGQKRPTSCERPLGERNMPFCNGPVFSIYSVIILETVLPTIRSHPCHPGINPRGAANTGYSASKQAVSIVFLALMRIIYP